MMFSHDLVDVWKRLRLFIKDFNSVQEIIEINGN